MSRAFFGNSMIAILSANVSSTTLSASNNSNTSTISASAVGGRETFNYLWEQSGTVCTIAFPSAASTYFTGSGTTGTTTVYCNVIDTITGNTLNTDNCVITWIIVSQNVVISGSVTYNGTAQAYTLTGTPISPAPSGSPTTFTNAGTYVYPTNITSITPGSGYTLGTVTGSFVINRATISGTAASPSLNYNGLTQNGTVITNVLPAGASFSGSVTASGTNAGTYTSSITGIDNYQGTVNGGNLTIVALTISGTASSPSLVYNGATQNGTVITNVLPAGATFTGSVTASGLNAGTYTSSITGSGNYQGTVNGGTFTIVRATISGTAGNTNVNYNGSLQSATVITNVLPAGATFTGSVTASGTSAGSYTSSITGSGNYQGTVNGGNLTIVALTISGTASSPSLVYNGATQNGTVITNVLPAGATFTGSVTASGLNAGTYTSSITGSGNYQGTVNGGTFTITRIVITSMTFTLDGIPFTTAQSRTAGTSYTIAVSSIAPNGSQYSPGSLTASTAGSYSLTSSGTGNWQGSFTSPVLTITSTQSVAISGTVTYNGGAQAYTLTGTPASPAPSGSPASFTNAGTYVYPTNITSITPGSGYTLGTVSGSFVINKVTISGTPASPSLVYNGASQSATVISVVQPGGATFTGSVLATGTNAGTYTSSITGSGNYQGTVNGGTFTITRITISGTPANTTRTFNNAQQTATVITGVTSGATFSGSVTASGTAVGTYTSSITGTGNYQGTVNGGTLTIVNPAPAPSGSITVGSPITSYRVNCTANLSNATATGYAWTRVSGTTVSFAGSSLQTVQVTAPFNTPPGNSTVVRCTISYSGGSVAPTATCQWGLV